MFCGDIAEVLTIDGYGCLGNELKQKNVSEYMAVKQMVMTSSYLSLMKSAILIFQDIFFLSGYLSEPLESSKISINAEKNMNNI
jgi:hypothetical protein